MVSVFNFPHSTIEKPICFMTANRSEKSIKQKRVAKWQPVSVI